MKNILSSSKKNCFLRICYNHADIAEVVVLAAMPPPRPACCCNRNGATRCGYFPNPPLLAQHLSYQPRHLPPTFGSPAHSGDHLTADGAGQHFRTRKRRGGGGSTSIPKTGSWLVQKIVLLLSLPQHASSAGSGMVEIRVSWKYISMLKIISIFKLKVRSSLLYLLLKAYSSRTQNNLCSLSSWYR